MTPAWPTSPISFATMAATTASSVPVMRKETCPQEEGAQTPSVTQKWFLTTWYLILHLKTCKIVKGIALKWSFHGTTSDPFQTFSQSTKKNAKRKGKAKTVPIKEIAKPKGKQSKKGVLQYTGSAQFLIYVQKTL